MISLFLNTSSKWLNIALLKDGKTIDSLFERFDSDLSEKALYKTKELIENNNLSVNDIDEIVCVRGPGSFTGLRIGVTIAKTISYFLNKKLYSVSTLEVMATSVTGNVIVPIIDARRGYVYGAIYDKDYNVLKEESYIKLDDIVSSAKEYGSPVFVSTDEFDFETVSFKPDLDNLYKHNSKKEENSMTFVPNYLKLTEAEEKLNDSRNES